MAVGLTGGERVVLSPPALLANGTKVKEQRQEDEKRPDASKAKSPSAMQSQADADRSAARKE